MGYGSWSSAAYDALKDTRTSKPTSAIFTNSSVAADMNPKGLTIRESRDSEEHPESVAIIVALDVTGSMGRIPDSFVRGKLQALMDTLLSHGVKDPQVMFLAVGDTTCDRSPLQVGQFESANAGLDKWLTSTYLEGGGGGQNCESYGLAHLVAARHTSIDCFEKRGVKGFLFTLGDERFWKEMGPEVNTLLGYAQGETSYNTLSLIREAERLYHVFHIHVQHGGAYDNDPVIINTWKEALGERMLLLDNPDNVAELIAATVAVINGADIEAVTRSFSSAVAASVSTALAPVKAELPATSAPSGLIHL